MNNKKEISKPFDARIKTPCRLLLIGPSNSGKSTLLEKLISKQKNIFEHTFSSIILFSPHFDPIYTNISKIYKNNFKYYNNIPDNFNEFTKDKVNKEEHTLLIFEDMQQNVCSNENIAELFCIYSKHNNISVFLTLQNPFAEGHSRVTFFRNSTSLICFRPGLDAGWVRLIASKVCPEGRKIFLSIFEHAIKNREDGSKGYLFIDGEPKESECKYRSNITEDYHYCYITKGNCQGER